MSLNPYEPATTTSEQASSKPTPIGGIFGDIFNASTISLIGFAAFGLIGLICLQKSSERRGVPSGDATFVPEYQFPFSYLYTYDFAFTMAGMSILCFASTVVLVARKYWAESKGLHGEQSVGSKPTISD